MKNLELYPLITEKSAQYAEAGTYVFKSNTSYDKVEIKEFIEKRFSVKVNSVRTSIFSRSTKNKRSGKSAKSYYKKVYVKLSEGMKIPLFEGV